MRNARHTHVRNRAAGIVALLALAAIVAGCGGGSDSASETALRKKLAAGAQKLSDAKSLRASVLFEVVESGQPEELGCIILSIDSHGKPERFDLTFFDQNCSGGSEAHELIAVGRRAWASSSEDPENWSEAKIAPALLDDLDEERTDLGGLIAAAENIDAEPEGGSVDEGNGIFADVTAYSFEAPASAFPGTDEDLEDVDVEFEVLLDRKGYLRELTVYGGIDDTSASVTERYEDIGDDLGIRPPDPSDVHGKVTTIRSESDLDRLFGTPSL